MPKRGSEDLGSSGPDKESSPSKEPTSPIIDRKVARRPSAVDIKNSSPPQTPPVSSSRSQETLKRKHSSSTSEDDTKTSKKVVTSEHESPLGHDTKLKRGGSVNEMELQQERTPFVVNTEDPIGFEALKQKFFDLFHRNDAGADMAELAKEGRDILESAAADEEPNFKKQIVDGLFREYMLEEVVKTSKPWSPLVCFSIAMSKDGMGSALLPISLLLDLIDLLGLKECEAVFQFIEERLAMWQEPHFYTCKNAVLRMCNDLLRRLSQTQNTIFCGRILIFLSAYFPFSERSGLNVMSEFNTDNVTLYKTTDGSDDPEDSLNINEEREETLFEGIDIEIPGLDKVVAQCQEQKKKNMSVDYSMYVKFWSLQDFLRNPNLCYSKLKWKTFATYLSDLLYALESSKLLVEPGIASNLPGKSRNSDVDVDKTAKDKSVSGSASPTVFSSFSGFSIPTVEDDNHYFAKYLTNRRILELEICDPHFRRCFLVQVLIVLQYLVLPVKFKTESFVLNDDQSQFVTKATERVYTILSQIKPGGPKFVETVKHVLKREEIWSKWKNEGCVPLKKPMPPPVNVSTDPKAMKAPKSDSKKSMGPPSKISELIKGEEEFGDLVKEDTASTSKPRRLGSILKEAYDNNKFNLGNSELNRLWNICPDNLGACRTKGRDFMPSIETYFAEAMEELDQDPVVPFDPKREVKPKRVLGNPNFGWRGLRLLARRSPYFFQVVSGAPIHPLQNYLEYVLRKIAADLDIQPTAVDTPGTSAANS